MFEGGEACVTGARRPVWDTPITRDDRACAAVCNTDKGVPRKAKQQPIIMRNAGVVVFIKPCMHIAGFNELYGTERWELLRRT